MVVARSITTWISLLRNNDPEAAQPLWEEYFQRLVGLARTFLSERNQSAYSDEDAALSAIHSALLGIGEGRFPQLTNSNDLWSLLARITRNKAIDAWKKSVRQAGSSDDIEAIVDRQPNPELALQFADECRHRLDTLRDEASDPTSRRRKKRLYEIALLHLEGRTNPEISAELAIPLRTVERRMGIIRSLWAEDSE